MQCNDTVCPDKKEKTKVVFGSQVMKLDEFQDLVSKDEKLKKKMEDIEKELEENY